LPATGSGCIQTTSCDFFRPSDFSVGHSDFRVVTPGFDVVGFGLGVVGFDGRVGRFDLGVGRSGSLVVAPDLGVVHSGSGVVTPDLRVVPLDPDVVPLEVRVVRLDHRVVHYGADVVTLDLGVVAFDPDVVTPESGVGRSEDGSRTTGGSVPLAKPCGRWERMLTSRLPHSRCSKFCNVLALPDRSFRNQLTPSPRDQADSRRARRLLFFPLLRTCRRC
jgi:hypothetical protein